MSIRHDRPRHTRPFAPSHGDTICDADTIGEGEAREFVCREGKTAFELIVVGTAADPRAYLNQCPHFKIKMNIRSNEMPNIHGRNQCTWHYACFRPEDGHCISGPVEGCAIHSVPVAIRNGNTVIGEPEVSGSPT